LIVGFSVTENLQREFVVYRLRSSFIGESGNWNWSHLVSWSVTKYDSWVSYCADEETTTGFQ